jgi:hypothetical protein
MGAWFCASPSTFGALGSALRVRLVAARLALLPAEEEHRAHHWSVFARRKHSPARDRFHYCYCNGRRMPHTWIRRRSYSDAFEQRSCVYMPKSACLSGAYPTLFVIVSSLLWNRDTSSPCLLGRCSIDSFRRSRGGSIHQWLRIDSSVHSLRGEAHTSHPGFRGESIRISSRSYPACVCRKVRVFLGRIRRSFLKVYS